MNKDNILQFPKNKIAKNKEEKDISEITFNLMRNSKICKKTNKYSKD